MKLMAVLYISTEGYIGYLSLNPQSTCYNVGLHVRPQHSPCPCYTPVLSRYWHVGTIHFRQTWVGAIKHRLIDRSVEQTERRLYHWYYLRIVRQ